MLKKNLKSNLYIDELKAIKGFLKLSLQDIKEKEQIFTQGHGQSYAEVNDIRNRIENCSLDDPRLKNLLEKYLQIVDTYNKEYSDYNQKHLKFGYLVVDKEERDKLLSRHKQSIHNLYQKINRRIEEIII